jgi:hypothetical protein
MLESNTRGYARRSSGASLGDLPFCGRRISFSRRSCEPFFQLTFFGGQSDGQQLADFLVQLPQLVDRHGSEIQLFAQPLLSGLCNSKLINCHRGAFQQMC